ncbi:MAG: B12-binding domain-containing radical SAM protein [Clostridiales bacterium]|nr:B12-binding domain-containing radical SAM protein [Clostridiales bacterium]
MQRYKKIQLISPPSNRTVEGQQKWVRWAQPLGIMSIATYLQQNIPELEIEILDFDCILDMDKEEDRAQVGNADVVGLSITFAQVDKGLELARLAKERGADVIIGGNIATSLNQRLLIYHTYVDYCICYDGEDAWLELVKGTELSKIPNLVYRENGLFHQNNYAAVDLRRLPIIDRSYVNFKDYFNNTKDADYKPMPYFDRPTNMYSLKGCSWRAQEGGGCYFCSIHDKGLRSRLPQQIWEERKMLVDKYDVNYIWDPSDNFIADPQWFQELYDCRPKDFFVPFSNYIRIDFVTKERARMLHEIGCVQVFCGMESGSNKALKALNKNIDKDMIENALKILGEYNITVVLGIVIGAKGETQETVLETLNFMKYLLAKYENLDRFEWGTLAPLPGSKAFVDVMNHPELREKYQEFGKGNIMSMLEQMVEDWPEYMCDDDIDFDYFLYIQQLAQEHLPYNMTRYQKRAWCGTPHKAYIDDKLVYRENW